MAVRLLINAFMVAVLLLGGSAWGADGKRAQTTRKQEIIPPSPPLSRLGKILLKKKPLVRHKGTAGSGDFWTPELLKKIQANKK